MMEGEKRYKERAKEGERELHRKSKWFWEREREVNMFIYKKFLSTVMYSMHNKLKRRVEEEKKVFLHSNKLIVANLLKLWPLF